MSSRGELIALADAVLDAWLARNPDAAPCTPSVRYTENGHVVRVGAGLWSSVTSQTFRWIVADPDSRQVLAFAALMEGDAPCLVALRGRAQGQRWVELEALVSRKRQSSIFAPERLTQLDPLYEQPVPRAERAALQAVADGYFEGLERDDVSLVSFDEACRRFENGALTTGNPDFLGGLGCREQFEQRLFAYIERVRARRYPVIDAERGLVGAIVFLDVPGTTTHLQLHGQLLALPPHMRSPRSVYLFEVFKVSDGRIREIQAFMVNLPYLASSGWD
jgi:hypothetical protein